MGRWLVRRRKSTVAERTLFMDEDTNGYFRTVHTRIRLVFTKHETGSVSTAVQEFNMWQVLTFGLSRNFFTRTAHSEH